MTVVSGAGVIRKRRKGLQVQVFAGRDPLTGRKRWLEWRQQVRPISPVTVANYRGAIDRHIIPALGRAKVHEVDAATLDTLYARVRATGGKCRYCWRRIRLGEPPLRAGVRYRPRPGADEAVHEPDCARGWPSLVGYLTLGATPTWLLGSFPVLSLLYRAKDSADLVQASAKLSADHWPSSARHV
jgi:hypothetical protein